MTHKEFAISVAKEAGEIMLAYFDSEHNDVEIKEDNSPVTIADKKINDLVIKRVREAYPEHGVLAEEGSDFSGDEEYVWVCDPIDGTIPYVHGIPTSMFSLALVDRSDGQPIFGLLYDPFAKNLFVAEKESGAYCNGKPLAVSSKKGLRNSLIGAEGSHIKNAFSISYELRSIDVHTMKINCITYTGSFVAKKTMEGAMYFGDKSWDVAALKIIIEEAGGKTSSFSGKQQRYDEAVDGFVGSNGHVHDELLKIINDVE